MAYPVIVCIDGHPEDDSVLIAARHKANHLKVAWCAVLFGETNESHAGLAQQQRRLLLETKIRALGGHLQPYNSSTSVKISEFLTSLASGDSQEQYLFVRKSIRRWWQPSMTFSEPKWQQSLESRFTIHRIASEVRQNRWWRLRGLFGGETLRELLPVLFYVGGVTLLLEILGYTYPQASFIVAPENVAMIYLIACMVAAILHGLVPALITGLLSMIAINYYFTAPFNVLYIEDGPQLFQAVLFLLAAIVIALIGSGARYNVMTMRQRERQLHTLLALSRTLNLSLNKEVALEHIESELKDLLHRDVIFFLPANGDVTRIGRQFPEHPALDSVSQAALNICWFDYVPTGAGTDPH